ncbi:AAA family ATPase [Maridesulfovibrio sp. FT414]|uniref:AAA family ATPase n=1 Tax=Maridesulfovibrio sp. FT414 TaxID=2979469 RepID=UPI003D8081D0
MIRKIILKDFLAHAETEIELGEGMTVLTGPNNSGKSSVVEALRCIATNPLPRHFVRHGAKAARVELEMDDGVRVAWIRKKATAWYEVLQPGEEEWEVYAKFGRKPPEDVLGILRLNQVPLEGGSSLDVHIGNQRNPIFLLDQPASVAAQFFASSSEASHLLAMQTELKNRVRAAGREKTFQQQKMDRIREELDQLQTLPDVNLELESARSLKEQVDALEKEIPTLEGMLERRSELESYRDSLSGRDRELSVLDPPPELYPVFPLEGIVARIDGLRRNNAMLTAKTQELGELQTPPELFPVQRLEADMSHRKRLSRAKTLQSERASVLASLQSPPELTDISALSGAVSEISRFRFYRSGIGRRADALAPLAAPPELFDALPLIQLQGSINSLCRARMEAQSRLAELESAGEQLQLRIEQRLSEIGNCPLCGGELEADRMIGEGGHGS